ncbi:MAG: IMPACT family protein [Myxococcota bacterium]
MGDDADDAFRTIAGPAEREIDKIKGSRFIGRAFPVATADEAMERVEEMRVLFPDARHHCWAWRLGPGEDLFRYHDDGEPNGTGGQPILRQIDGHDLTNVVVIVIRYFGGTKLGTGGLARAYGAAAGAVLDASAVVERRPMCALSVTYGYPDQGAVQAVLHDHGLAPEDASYGARVSLYLRVPVDEADRIRAALRNATAGRAEVAPA